MYPYYGLSLVNLAINAFFLGNKGSAEKIIATDLTIKGYRLRIITSSQEINGGSQKIIAVDSMIKRSVEKNMTPSQEINGVG